MTVEAILEAADPKLTRVEAAAYLRLKPSTLATWASTNEGPPFLKVGGAVRYALSDLDTWLASRRVCSGGARS